MCAAADWIGTKNAKVRKDSITVTDAGRRAAHLSYQRFTGEKKMIGLGYHQG
jgi:hypothetical protein